MNYDLSNSDNNELLLEYDRLLVENNESKFIQNHQLEYERDESRHVAPSRCGSRAEAFFWTVDPT